MHFGLIKEVSAKSGKLFVGLDIGTTKVCAIVAEVSYNGTDRNALINNGNKECDVNIIGVGSVPSGGIKKGVVTNIESTVESIRAAVKEAEATSGVEIRAVHTGITGSHVSCLSSNGIIAIKDDEIGHKEVESVIDAARTIAIPVDREMLHVIPVDYTVDGQDGITDPRGMGGVRLETDVQIITCAATSIKNIVKSCQKAELEVIDIIYQPLASAEAVLTQDEKDLGIAMIDIGGGTTDIALFQNGNICHSAVFALGGNNFTNDVAIGLRIPSLEAEKIKKRYGSSMISLVKDDDEIDIGSDDKTGRTIPRSYLVEILQPRAEELFTLIKEEICGNGFYEYMNSGVVLTGGGVMMEGMDVMAEHILELPVRIGNPDGFGGLTKNIGNPMYSTGAGMILYRAHENIMEQASNGVSKLSGITGRMKGWVGGLFN